jgi:integrase
MAELKTQADVFKLRVEKDRAETVYYDRGPDKLRVAGLALRVRPSSRTWVLFYRWRGPQHRLTIGDATAFTLEDARKEARRWHRVMLDEKKNPVEVQRLEKAQRDAKPTIFKSVMEQYLAARQKDMKPRSYDEITRHLESHWKPLHALDLKAVDQGTVAAHLNAIERDSGPVARNRARSTLSALFTWAIAEGHPVTNPVDATRKAAEKARERVLSNAELATIWNGADESTDYGKIVRLLLLTGQRREEIGGLQWPEIAADAQGRKLIALPRHRTKNGRAHDVPLSAEALALIEGTHRTQGRPYVFGSGEGGYSGWSRSKGRLDDVLGLPEWTLHDLRRSMATRMADSPEDGGLGIQPHVIEAILNHVSGHKAGVAGIYNRSTYAAEKRAALDAWAKHLAVIVAQANGENVVPMRGRK